MSISDLDLSAFQDSVTVAGKTFTVSGLTFDALEAVLIGEGMNEARELFDTLKLSGGDVLSDMETLRMAMKIAPNLLCRIIAYAAGEPEAFSIVKKMPLPVQVDALVKIFRLTFVDMDNFENFVKALTTATQGVTKLAARAT